MTTLSRSPFSARLVRLRLLILLSYLYFSPDDPSPEPSTPPPVDPPPTLALALVRDDMELQELGARARILEAKHADDPRHVRELENGLNEAGPFIALRPKL